MVGWFRFEVIDSGVGMSVEQQKAVFEEFTHFKKNKLHGGGENSAHIYCIYILVAKLHDIRRQRTRIVDISPHCGYASGRVAASEDRSIRLLTIIIWIVLCVQGVLGVHSEGLGHGSTFFFELPLYAEDVAAPSIHFSESIQESPRSLNNEIRSSPSNVLLKSVRSLAHHSFHEGNVLFGAATLFFSSIFLC